MRQPEDLGFSYRVRRSGEVVVERDHMVVATLRGRPAERFIRDVEAKDPQQVMAKVTGQYRRGNERTAKAHAPAEPLIRPGRERDPGSSSVPR